MVRWRRRTVIPLTVTLVRVGEGGRAARRHPDADGLRRPQPAEAQAVPFELKVGAVEPAAAAFRIRVAAPDHPDIAPVYTQPFKTMTKTYRAPVGERVIRADAEGAGRDAPAKRNAEAAGLDHAGAVLGADGLAPVGRGGDEVGRGGDEE